MDKQADRKPVDELFARKLENMSLPPSPNGFSRLQARLEQQQQPRLVFWRNPTVYRYGAVAACLLLVALFGWQYQSTNDTDSKSEQLASHKPVTKASQPAEQQQRSPDVLPDNGTIAQTTQPVGAPPIRNGREDVKTTDLSHQFAAATPVIRPPQNDNVSREDVKTAVAQNQPAISNASEKIETPRKAKEEQLATNNEATEVPAERVLVVTISEPETLVAARAKAQSVTDEKVVVATDEKETYDHQPGKLWQQVRRVKSGEVFARSDKNDDEHGLLNRAYSGLKRSIDKEKSSRQ